MNYIKRLSLGVALGAMLIAGGAHAETVRFWYHFDNPENPMADLVKKFQATQGLPADGVVGPRTRVALG